MSFDPSRTSSEGPAISPVPRITLQAFCETPEIAGLMNEAMADRRMSRAHAKVHMGGAPAAVEAYRTAPTPNLIVIETTGDRDTLVTHLDRLAEYCDSGTKVVVIGRLNDIVLYRELIGRGVSDYLVAPFAVLDLVRALSHLYSHAAAPPVGRMVAVTGAKGGVGASTLAHNVAWSISRSFDIATTIVDLDLPYGTAGLDFNQDPPQGIAEAVFAPDRLDANLVDRLLSKCTDKLSLLAAPAVLERAYDFGETAFDGLFDILRSTVPVVVLDVPHGWTAWSRRALIGADEVMVTAAPDLASLRNAKNLVDVLKAARPNDAAPRLVLNGVGLPKRPEIAAADFAKSLEMQPTAVVPFDAKLFGTASNNGQMIGEVEAGGRTAELFAELGRTVMGRTEPRRGKKTLFDPFVARFARKKAS
ncbi:AAA family ATPase [Lichenibacterium dinghuense]|uniref:AAA family ATPase n=1 Tax=Lichenibacterium dinghuense TaxID=2895977 RepID=UPI001F1F8F25|nr:CpaE family protein [Lichenibacterium sp. 6Y81]